MIYMWDTCAMVCTKVRRQLCGAGSLLSPICVFWGFNSGHQGVIP